MVSRNRSFETTKVLIRRKNKSTTDFSKMRGKSKGSGTWPKEMPRSSRPRRCAAFFAQIPKIGTRSFGAKKMEAGQTPEKELQSIAGLRNQAILGKTLPLNAACRLPQDLAAKPSLPLAASCNSKQACLMPAHPSIYNLLTRAKQGFWDQRTLF